jgi:predicted alpha-1,2-mannosidase
MTISPVRGLRRAARLTARPPAFLAAGAAAVLAGSLILPGSPAGAAAGAVLVSDPAALVSPLIGTANQGDDFPGADAPFGMVQWSPDTPSRPDGGGYAYGDSSITGFSLTHMSGPGCLAFGDVPVLPTVGKVIPSAADAFSHASESATAGYYQVGLRNGVTTELTATTRTGMARFTFPVTAKANLIFKLTGSQRGESATSFTVLSSTEVRGSVTSVNFCGTATPYTVHFDMRFSRPFTASGTYAKAGLRPGARHLAVRQPRPAPRPSGVPAGIPEQPGHPVYHGKLPAGHAAPAAALAGPHGAYLTFSTIAAGNRTLLAKVGISYVSAVGAAANLAAENPGWDFAATRAATTAAWNALLTRVRVSGGTAAQQHVFYTALYHSLLDPSIVSDDSGQYEGTDQQAHTVDAGHSAFYSNFSGWDIYRTQAQLEALLDPRAASDTAQSMIDDYAQDGMLPKWAAASGESYMMVGDPADPIIAGYYAFGARDFDTAAALADMTAEATTPGNIRPGLNYLTAPGYLPADGTYGCCNAYGPVSTTLEYDTADFALSAFAGALGDTAGQQAFANRAQDWRNVLNPASGFDQPRNADGTWAPGFDPTSQAGLVEDDSWIYTGMVPFNLAGLARAKGGTAPMAAYLGTVLRSFTGKDGYARIGNEPSIGLPWEYDYAGQPWHAQETIRQIQDQIWTDTPGGLADGNDDLGAMSAWYIWSALGMYPMTPGTPDLALGSPLFPRAVLTLPSGAALTINGDGAADSAPYVQSATWNGAAWNNAYAPAAAITAGGILAYTLAATPNKTWASAPSQAPPSYPGTTAPPAQPRTGPAVSGASARLCIDVRNSATANGTPVQTAGCNATDSQEWTIAADGTIRSLGKCLDARNSGATDGTPVDLYTCNGTTAQNWTIQASGTITNPHSGNCLTNPGPATTTGTQLQLTTCNTTPAQNWKLPPAPAPAAATTTRTAQPPPATQTTHP